MPSPDYGEESITLGLRRGKPQALSEALRMLADPQADRAKQLELLQILGEVRPPGAVPSMLRLGCESSDNALRSAALNALAGYDDPAIAARGDQGLFQHDRRRASRRPELAGCSSSLGEPVPRRHRERGPSTPRAFRARSSKSSCCSATPRSPIEQHVCWARSSPPPGPSFTARIDRLASVIREGSGIPKPGKKIFDQQCARCHLLFGQGGKVGPDLTTYRRDDLDTMLLNIVNPSAEIREGFVGSVVAMTDGRILTGVIVDQDKNVVVIRDSDGHEATLTRDAIDTMRPSPSSLMPEGLLDQLTGQAVRDLFAYLRSTQPLID